jgi:hypothetical protein
MAAILPSRLPSRLPYPIVPTVLLAATEVNVNFPTNGCIELVAMQVLTLEVPGTYSATLRAPLATSTIYISADRITIRSRICLPPAHIIGTIGLIVRSVDFSNPLVILAAGTIHPLDHGEIYYRIQPPITIPTLIKDTQRDDGDDGERLVVRSEKIAHALDKLQGLCIRCSQFVHNRFAERICEPCGHRVLCYECSELIRLASQYREPPRRCPLCYEEVERFYPEDVD